MDRQRVFLLVAGIRQRVFLPVAGIRAGGSVAGGREEVSACGWPWVWQVNNNVRCHGEAVELGNLIVEHLEPKHAEEVGGAGPARAATAVPHSHPFLPPLRMPAVLARGWRGAGALHLHRSASQSLLAVLVHPCSFLPPTFLPCFGGSWTLLRTAGLQPSMRRVLGCGQGEGPCSTWPAPLMPLIQEPDRLCGATTIRHHVEMPWAMRFSTRAKGGWPLLRRRCQGPVQLPILHAGSKALIPSSCFSGSLPGAG